MKIAISGASGFIGSHLTQYFTARGHEILPLGKELFADEASQRFAAVIGQSDVVINLAGMPINHRWTSAYKMELYGSRIDTTRRIVDTINASRSKPAVMISTSAAGYYPSEGCHDESAKPGTSFLSQLCVSWEAEARKVSPDVRLAITRFGVVLAPKGGAFEKMVLTAKYGVATIIGPGTQPFAWIDIDDLVRVMDFIIKNPDARGPVNLVAPQQVTNKEFTRKMADHYRSLLTVKVPEFFFRVIFGESSQFMTRGQCVVPGVLQRLGFVFKTPDLGRFLNNLPYPKNGR